MNPNLKCQQISRMLGKKQSTHRHIIAKSKKISKAEKKKYLPNKLDILLLYKTQDQDHEMA